MSTRTARSRADHRRHRPGRRLPGRVPARQGLRGPRHQAPRVALQHRPHRPPVPGSARRGPPLHPALRRPDRLHQPDPHHPAGPARRDLQPGGAEPRRGVASRSPSTPPTPTASARCGCWRRSASSASRRRRASTRPHLRALRPGAGNAADGDDAVLPAHRPMRSPSSTPTGSRSTTARPTACMPATASSSTTRSPVRGETFVTRKITRAHRAHRARPAGLPVPRQPRRAARLGPRPRLRRGAVADAAAGAARGLRHRHRRAAQRAPVRRDGGGRARHRLRFEGEGERETATVASVEGDSGDDQGRAT